MQECVSRAFLHVMRSMWPGINGNPGGSPAVVSKMRKRAVQASKFMLQMIQAPLYIKETEVENEAHNSDLPETIDNCMQYSLECGEEGLAIRIATEVLLLALRFDYSICVIDDNGFFQISCSEGL